MVVLILMLLAVSTPRGAAAPPDDGTSDPDATELRQQIDTLLEEHVGITTPGAMVTVVGPDGPLLSEAEGWADPLSPIPLTPASRTPVASVSKVVTSLTALRLENEGLLDLDAEVRDQLPVRDRRDPAVTSPVTGRHLLTHHSGLSEPLLTHPDLSDPPPRRPARCAGAEPTGARPSRRRGLALLTPAGAHHARRDDRGGHRHLVRAGRR